ncbi:MAG: hypothetical protein JWO59_3201 [Chloroflexi bacterium]|nr:hypothetical protein [Chloroflexota bacterium]
MPGQIGIGTSMQDEIFPHFSGSAPKAPDGDGSAAQRSPIQLLTEGHEIPAASWRLLPQAVGIGLRVVVWLGVFAVLLFGLFTYPALLIGGFLFVVLVARHLRTAHL